MEKLSTAWTDLKVIYSAINLVITHIDGRDELENSQTYLESARENIKDLITNQEPKPEELIGDYTSIGNTFNTELRKVSDGVFAQLKAYDKRTDDGKKNWERKEIRESVEGKEKRFMDLCDQRNVSTPQQKEKLEKLQKEVNDWRLITEAILLREQLAILKDKQGIVKGNVFRKEKWVKSETFWPWKIKVDDELTYEKMFVSCTKIDYTAKKEDFKSDETNKWVVIQITSHKNGVDISKKSAKPDEQEVLFPIGTNFKVVKVITSRGTNIHLHLVVTEIEKKAF